MSLPLPAARRAVGVQRAEPRGRRGPAWRTLLHFRKREAPNRLVLRQLSRVWEHQHGELGMPVGLCGWLRTLGSEKGPGSCWEDLGCLPASCRAR